MATFEATKVRLVAGEVAIRLKELYAAVLPGFVTVSGWELNRTDPFLPTPFQIRVVLEMYRALEVQRLRLDEYVKEFLGAGIEDTLTYPTPPSSGAGSGLADGGTLADGSTLANGEGA
jgi:hypothetical protein